MKLIKTIFAVALAALTVSCSNLVDDDDNSTVKTAAPGQAYISVNVTNQDNSARTLLPKIEISNLVLTGGLSGTAQTVLAKADSLDEMSEKQIAVQTGDWNFTLTATVSGIDFTSGTVSKTIASGSENPLSFTLEPIDNEEIGVLNFTIIPTGTEGVNYHLRLYFDSDPDPKTTRTFTSGQKFNYILPTSTGTHTMRVEFYAEDANNSVAVEDSISELLNTYKSIVRIEKGITTTAVIENYNLNDVYSITYDGYEKEAKDGVPVADTLDPTTSVMTLKFSRKGGIEGCITLPKLKNQKEKDGVLVDCMTFSGWYTSSDFADGTLIPDFDPNDSSKMQKIEVSENLSDITLYAKWLVNSTGKIYTPMDYNFTIAAEGLWSEKGKANTVTITPTATRKELSGTDTALTCSPDGKLTFADGTEVSENELVTFTAKLYDENKSASADITPDGFTFTIPVQNFSENYTLKVTATYLGIAHDASFTYKVTDGVVSVPAGSFDTSTGIIGSAVFITNRTSVANMKALIASDHEVTQGEYEKYCTYGGSTPSATYGKGENYPAYYVSWYNTLVYCNKRSTAEGLTPCYKINGSTDTSTWGSVPSSSNDTWNAATCNFDADGWRLPTEAEWEYLARGGNLTNSNQTIYSGSDTVGEVAWYYANSDSKTHEVCTKAPNGLGLYDMSGNVREWCWDWYGSITATGPSATPATGPASSSDRVARGGSRDHGANYCAVSYHDSGCYSPADWSYSYLGFRVVRNAE